MPAAFWTAMRNNVRADDFFAYELWRSPNKSNIDNYLYFWEMTRIFKSINRVAQPDVTNDKLAFHQLCRNHGMPSAPIIAVSPSLKTEALQFPQRDLFIKPRFGPSGLSRGYLRWTGEAFENEIGQTLLAENLVDWDAQGIPAYLESTNPGNDHRYARAGFLPIGGFSAVLNSAHVTTMWRAVPPAV